MIKDPSYIVMGIFVFVTLSVILLFIMDFARKKVD